MRACAGGGEQDRSADLMSALTVCVSAAAAQDKMPTIPPEKFDEEQKKEEAVISWGLRISTEKGPNTGAFRQPGRRLLRQAASAGSA